MVVHLKKDDTGSYKLASKQENCLRNKGYFPLEESDDIEDSLDDNAENIAGTFEEVTDNELPGGTMRWNLCLESIRTLMFWNIRFILNVTVRKMTCGCQQEAFNQPVDYTSLSSYGCK